MDHVEKGFFGRIFAVLFCVGDCHGGTYKNFAKMPTIDRERDAVGGGFVLEELFVEERDLFFSREVEGYLLAFDVEKG